MGTQPDADATGTNCRLITVLAGQLAVCSDREQGLTTPALGAAIAVAVLDRNAGVGGLLHFLFPDSLLDPALATDRPELFADTGIDLLLGEMHRAIQAPHGQLEAWVVGGADALARASSACDLALGERNIAAATRRLQGAGITVTSVHTGGHDARRLTLELAGGSVRVTATPGTVTPEPGEPVATP